MRRRSRYRKQLLERGADAAATASAVSGSGERAPEHEADPRAMQGEFDMNGGASASPVVVTGDGSFSQVVEMVDVAETPEAGEEAHMPDAAPAPVIEPTADEAPLAVTPSLAGFSTAAIELPPPAPPTPEERLYLEARDATRRGDLAGARRVYATLLARAPQHVRAHNNLALLLAEQGDVEMALKSFQRALDLAPEDPELLANRASVLSAAHRYDLADADLRKAMRLAPDHVETLVQFALVRSRRALWREALEPLRRALALDPTHAAAWYHLGEAANQAGQLSESVDAFRQAIAHAPGMWRAQKGLGNVLDRLGRVEEAALAHRAARAVQAAGREVRS